MSNKVFISISTKNIELNKVGCFLDKMVLYLIFN